MTKPAAAPKVNPGPEKAARFLDLLSQDGVRPGKGDIIALVNGPATPLVLTDAAYRAKIGGKAKPNLELASRLRTTGAEVPVCSQALTGQGIGAIADRTIQIEVAALAALANLQLRGYAPIRD